MLHRLLNLNGLKGKNIISDNNCQFHAILDQCLQNGIVGWNHAKLRVTAVEWLYKNKDTQYQDAPLNVLFDLSNPRLKQLVQHSREWGDSSTLFALANILEATIKVYSSANNIYEIHPIDGNSNYIFHIGYYNNLHYISTIPIPVV